MPVEAWEGLLRAAATAQNDDRTIGVAVSGGSDSLAALHLLRAVGARVSVATVNHGLRTAAAEEAAEVARHCAGLGVQHDTLVWKERPKGQGNVMEQAREARYRLLADWAKQRGIGAVVLGHTADDQAETFLMALARGTGLDGLVGMRPAFVKGGITFLRPFLHISRADLRVYLKAQNLQWTDDPTNDNPRFSRTRARKIMQALGPLGITAAKLQTTMANLQASQLVVRQALATAALQVTREDAGALRVDLAGFADLTADLKHRLMTAAVKWIAGDLHPARADGVRRLIKAALTGKGLTLAGCRLHGDWLAREAKAIGDAQGTTALWDNRWHLTGPHAPDLTIRALGDGIRQCPDWRATGLSRDVLVVTPAIWSSDTLIAAPLAGLPNGWTAEITQSFHAFILSH